MTSSHQNNVGLFEQQTRDERIYYDGLSIDDLHMLIQERQFGRTGVLWQSLRERTTLLESAWIRLDMLDHRTIHNSARIQAASVLLQLADSHDWSAESLADDADPMFETRLTEFRRIVMACIRRVAG